MNLLRTVLIVTAMTGLLMGRSHAVPPISFEDKVVLVPSGESDPLLRITRQAWDILCLDYAPLTDRSCVGIQRPKVLYVESLRGSLRGQYDGGDTIYVLQSLRGYLRDTTLIHEMSHYLDTRLGLNPEMPVFPSETEKVFLVCVSEKRAWDLIDHFWRDRGVGRRAENGAWVTWYDYCKPFASDLYPNVYKKPIKKKTHSNSVVRGRMEVPSVPG